MEILRSSRPLQALGSLGRRGLSLHGEPSLAAAAAYQQPPTKAPRVGLHNIAHYTTWSPDAGDNASEWHESRLAIHA